MLNLKHGSGSGRCLKCVKLSMKRGFGKQDILLLKQFLSGGPIAVTLSLLLQLFTMSFHCMSPHTTACGLIVTHNIKYRIMLFGQTDFNDSILHKWVFLNENIQLPLLASSVSHRVSYLYTTVKTRRTLLLLSTAPLLGSVYLLYTV